MGTYFYEDVELRLASADDSDQKQIEQINQFVADGIDLLIVAPNQAATVSPAIDQAFDKGIPVIVFDRKTNSEKFTAYIGADNYEMGRIMGKYICTRLGGKGKVLEIMGLKGSSPAIDRHNGFMDAMKSCPNITVVASLQGDWTEESAVKAIKAYDGDLSDIDFVFGQNDRMAVGASKTLPPGHTKYCGIDGLPGKEGGIACVRDSVLEATYIYPTHGDEVMQLAMNILKGKPYQKDNPLMGALVTRDNAKVMQLQNEEIARQSDYLDQLHEQSDDYLHQLDAQRIVTWMAVGIIALLLIAIVLFYRYHLNKVAMQRERVIDTLWNIPREELPAEPEQPEETPEAEEESQTTESTVASRFLARFKEVVEARMSDSDVSVEDLAADMNLSRVQLYRKVKAVTDSSPVEILRTARLKRAYQLLVTTDKNISEVAYDVGFTAPSYFTKCFKDEFGISPSDL
jgi:ABC-type sugar transport system substrate-binding protein